MSLTDEFFSAIRSGDVQKFEELLSVDPTLASARQGGVSALLAAAYQGQSSIAQSIGRRRDDLTLPEACAIGDRDRAMVILANDPSSIDAPGDDGHYPVGLAIFFRHPELARQLIEAGADVNLRSRNAQQVAPVHAAVAVGDRATLGLLLQRGADPDARQEMGYAPLHEAAGRGDVETAKLLLDGGAARDARTSEGKSVADIAREKGRDLFVTWLDTL